MAGYVVLSMSVTIYACSMQYVAVDLLAGGASFFTTVIMTLMVNIRHLFYGVSMLSKYKDAGKYKPYLIFALTDETFSIACDAQPVGVRPALPENRMRCGQSARQHNSVFDRRH